MFISHVKIFVQPIDMDLYLKCRESIESLQAKLGSAHTHIEQLVVSQNRMTVQVSSSLCACVYWTESHHMMAKKLYLLASHILTKTIT